MAQFLDLTGKKFGRWTVINHEGKRYAEQFWLCRCDCGTERVVIGGTLKKGVSKSCGCLALESMTKHGMEGTRIYNTWAQMLGRCNNPNATSFKRYGAKGIKVCDAWHDFRVFYADMGDIPEGRTLDRIDNDKGYSKENCRWADPKTQSRNRINTVMAEWNGKLMPVAEIAEINGIGRRFLHARLKRGIPIDVAISKQKIRRWDATNGEVK
jgi:hypothetical protein